MSKREAPSTVPDPKKQKTSHHEEEYANENIKRLKQVEEKLDDLEKELYNEVVKVRKNFYDRKKKLFQERNESISKVQDFWKTAFMNHPQLGQVLSEEDVNILSHCTEIFVDEVPDTSCTYTFKFKNNPYFKNDVLEKVYIGIENDEHPPQITSTQIQWNQGKGTQSKFFSNWFSNKADENDEAFAQILREEFWVRPIDYYLGVVEEFPMYMAEEEEGEDEGEEEGEGEE
jgi:template-activating factor I